MTKVELALIMTIIDKHTTTHTYNYGAPDSKQIHDIDALKREITTKYEEIMKEDEK